MNRTFPGMGGFQRPHRGNTDVWLTPPEIIKALGPFGLDPCAAPEPRPWETAARSFTEQEDGLQQEWSGRVWLNPPYGPETGAWLEKLARHGNGIALVFARTETTWFSECIWHKADALRFVEGRLNFYHLDGTRSDCNSGAPSVLVAYGSENARVLRDCRIRGAFIALRGGDRP